MERAEGTNKKQGTVRERETTMKNESEKIEWKMVVVIVFVENTILELAMGPTSTRHC